MAYRILLAGAAGVIGRRLTPLLLAAGHQVTGTTRSLPRAKTLADQGVEPVLVDVFDAQHLRRVVTAAQPDIVMHQLSDLPPGLDPAHMAEAVRRNARIRSEGTGNLVEAAVTAGATRLIAQSIAWAYAPGCLPYTEDASLDRQATGARAISVGGVMALEDAVLQAPLFGIVLRYGQLYGPGTGADAPQSGSSVHVDAAAHAALLAVMAKNSGIYNIAEPGGNVATMKAERMLGWHADFRLTPTLEATQ